MANNSERVARMEELAKEIRAYDHTNVFAPPELLYEYKKLWDEEMTEKNKGKEAKSKEMRNRRRRGKYGEKKLSKEVGVRRDGGVGRRDAGNSMFSYEVKTIKTLPASIIKIMAQAERLKKKGTVAVGVFRCNSPRQEYFILERSDWLELHGK